MAGYTKRIALIRTLKNGYSADGGELKGVARCESYAGFLRADVSLINFAPLSEGAYRTGVSDGSSVVVFDAPSFEGECSFDASRGFACLVCYCRSGEVTPIAAATSGESDGILSLIHEAILRDESPEKNTYNDEAIAEENYYELEADKDGGAVCPDEKEKEGSAGGENEEDAGSLEGGEAEEGGHKFPLSRELPSGERVKCSTSSFRAGGGLAGEAAQTDGGDEPPPSAEKVEQRGEEGDTCGEEAPEGDAAAQPRLSDGGFYERMSADVRKIFSAYPRLPALEDVIENSRWAKISYGNGAHYAFGVIYQGGKAAFLCYAVPVESDAPCPESLRGRASYVPVDGGGYWVMYQDANTGISVTAT